MRTIWQRGCSLLVTLLALCSSRLVLAERSDECYGQIVKLSVERALQADKKPRPYVYFGVLAPFGDQLNSTTPPAPAPLALALPIDACSSLKGAFPGELYGFLSLTAEFFGWLQALCCAQRCGCRHYVAYNGVQVLTASRSTTITVTQLQ